MCGRVGYIGYKKVIPILLAGLKSLEYRGYDSAGIAVIEDNRLQVIRNTGKIDALKEKVATLESELKTKSEELAEAQKKAKLLEMSEVVEVVETDASGKQIKRKIMKTPYIPTGDIATVIAVDQSNGLVCIN